MKTVLLVHEGPIQHYRIPVYNYMSESLLRHDYSLFVVAESLQMAPPQEVRFRLIRTRLRFSPLQQLVNDIEPKAVILWAKPHLYSYPFFVMLKMEKIKIIHWGHRRPWPPFTTGKKLVANFDHWLDDAIILYSDQFQRFVFKRFRSKTFIANNTLNLTEYRPEERSKASIKQKYGITTDKNIIYIGRIQKRRHLDHLVRAFNGLSMGGVGLILAGPDDEGLLESYAANNVFRPGPLYGNEALDLLSASDVYCQPGAIGLSIVDALFCGLPVVTEDGIHGPEIMYLKDGVNGFIVPKGDVVQLAAKLQLLLTDDSLRRRFSQAGRNEIMTRGHIDRMCEGFLAALDYVLGESKTLADIKRSHNGDDSPGA
jgi:glycosyltransferase involved in cell wall biosynthesis